jgi:L-iditol 2-dehydrogenase
MLIAKAFGAEYVLMTDVVDARLKQAKDLGADAVVKVSADDNQSAQDIVKAAGGLLFDAAIECCGFESATRTGIHVCKPGGTVCVVGMRQADMKLPIMEAGIKEVDIRGIFRYKNTYPTCISLLASKKLNVKGLITHRYGMDEILTAFETAKTGRDGAIKVMFNLS